MSIKGSGLLELLKEVRARHGEETTGESAPRTQGKERGAERKRTLCSRGRGNRGTRGTTTRENEKGVGDGVGSRGCFAGQLAHVGAGGGGAA